MTEASIEARRPNGTRALLAIGLVGLLLASGLVLLATPTSAAPVAGAPRSVLNPLLPETGSQLQQSSYLSDVGSRVAPGPNTSVVGPTPAAQPVQFTVGFALQNESRLEAILAEQEQPGSPLFHHWLTNAQEVREFGPNPVVVEDTINYFTSLGFTVGTEGATSISFLGPASATQTAFRTPILEMRVNGTEAPVNSQPLSLPSPIAPYIATVNGLSGDHFNLLPLQMAPSPFDNATNGGAPSGGVAPSVQPFAPPGANETNISALYNVSNHAFAWVQFPFSARSGHNPVWQLITPGALANMYQIDPLLQQGYNGGGKGHPIEIAIYMCQGLNPTDVRTYSTMAYNNPTQLLSRLSVDPVDGAWGLNGTVTWTDSNSCGGELAIDTEWSSTMAPGAKILDVLTPGLATNQIDDAYANMDNLATTPNIISNSWGGSEDAYGTFAGPSWSNTETLHQYIMLLTAKGATVLASSGDGGGFDSRTGMLAGSNPATDPYVLAVNGVRTVAQGVGGKYPLDPNLGWFNYSIGPINARGWDSQNFQFRVATETGLNTQSYWYVPYSNTTLYNEPPYASGGFGISNWFNQSWWQHSPFMPNLGRSLGSGVSAEADFNESILVDGYWHFGWGGTSFGCPTTAGMFADIEDYLQQHGLSPYLGNGNPVTTLVGNAYYNGNLSLVPYYAVTNGTSFWGNHGAALDWSWPRGDLFPSGPGGFTYGNTTPGWNFPTGWGTINGYNFAVDLTQLYTLPGQFTTVTSSGLNWDPSAWPNLALNNTYTFHVNASAALQSTNPKVTLVFFDQSGTPRSWQPNLTTTGVSPGYDFTINTALAPFDSPGTIYFEFGNSVNRTLGFAYDWVARDAASLGSIHVSIVSPSITGGGFPGGSAIFNANLGWGGPSGGDYPTVSSYGNTVQVKVTDQNGNPVYNAVVNAYLPNVKDEAIDYSLFDQQTNYGGTLGAQSASTLLSSTFTNVTGIALVYTDNVVKPVPITVNASYGALTASTSFNETPMPNVRAVDAYGGNDSQFNLLQWWLQYWSPYAYRQHPTWNASNSNALAANSWNQSSYYSMLYGWQGEELPLQVTNSTGAPVANDPTYLGNWDLNGHQTQFVDYSPSGETLGITNASGTANVTDASGMTTLYIPDNQTPAIGYNLQATAGGADNLPYTNYVGIDMVAVTNPGYHNYSFGYSEPCYYPFPLNPSQKFIPPYTCTYNASWDRNYSATPVLVFPDPINLITETRTGIHQDFFSVGTNVSVDVQVQLPDQNPWNPLLNFNEPGTNWNPGLEHVVSAEAYVDGIPALALNPQVAAFQWYNVTGNLTGRYAPGIHDLVVVVRDSIGHVFTQHRLFIVGSVAFANLPPSKVYEPMPFDLNWTTDIPSAQVSNKTFNMSLEIQYVTGGCEGKYCPLVVNQTIKVHPGQTTFGQNINRSLLEQNGFFSGAGDFPPGQYAFTVWLGANHSGSVEVQGVRYLVFDPLVATINGPSPGALVPVGNVTISYSYDGLYITGATLSVYPKGGGAPVYQQGAFVPGTGNRGNATTWPSVATGAYRLVLNVTTPYQNLTTSEWINVTQAAPTVWQNSTGGQHPVGSLPVAATAAALAIVAAVVGLLTGRLLLAPRRRASEESGAAGGAGAAARANATEGNVCPTCHDRFETAGALQNHRHLVHGEENG